MATKTGECLRALVGVCWGFLAILNCTVVTQFVTSQSKLAFSRVRNIRPSIKAVRTQLMKGQGRANVSIFFIRRKLKNKNKKEEAALL